MPRSPSPSRDRDARDRSASPPRAKPWSQKRAKELSFYKKSYGSSAGGGASRGHTVGDLGEEETAKERAQRRERGEVPKRFGGSREQGVRNTMGNIVVPVGGGSGSVGSLRRGGDPLDRLGVRGDKRDRDSGSGSGSRDREYRDRDRDYERRRDDRDRDYDRRRDDRDRDRRDDRRDDRDRSERDLRHPDRRDPSGPTSSPPAPRPGRFIEVIANDRMGRKVRVKCLPTDTVGDLKKLIAAQTGTSAQKIVLKKWYTAFKDHVTLQDYEINDGMSLEMY